MKKLRKLAGGNTFTIIYLKMQLLSIKKSGIILFESIEDNLADELALELDESPEDVQMTLLFLEKHGMIEQISADEYLLPEAAGSIGTESESAARVRKHRELQSQQQAQNVKALQCNMSVTACNDDETTIRKPVTLEKEVEQKKEKELEPPIPPRGERGMRRKKPVKHDASYDINEIELMIRRS